jgi:hypothetical protein
VEVKEEYQAKISKSFAALEKLDNDDVAISRFWKNTREKVKLQPQRF